MGIANPLLFSGVAMAGVLNEDYVQCALGQVLPEVDVLLVEMAPAGSQLTVRVFLDHPEGVTLALCAQASQLIENALDRDHVLDRDYTIEVSSPGLNRPLRTPAHFAAQQGKRIKIRTLSPVAGRKMWEGMLVEVGENAVVLREAGTDVTIRLADVAKANLVYEFE